MIPRYTRPEMGRLWSDESRFRTWLKVELAATETLAEAGIVPREAAKTIRDKADFKLERINEIETEVRHDVIAFTTAVAEFVGPESRWFHYGLTSNDVVDTAQALQIRQACRILLDELRQLRDVLKRRALEFRHTVQGNQPAGNSHPAVQARFPRGAESQAGDEAQCVGQAVVQAADGREGMRQRMNYAEASLGSGAPRSCETDVDSGNRR